MSKVRMELKNMLQKTVDKKEEEYAIDSIIDIELIKNLTEDRELGELLVNKTALLINLQIKNAISLGAIFYEVFNEISAKGSKLNGLYEKWLNVNGVSKHTALRYRKRYELYKLVKDDKKETIALLSQKYIDIIYLEENKEEYINLINNGATAKEIIEMLESKNNIEIENKEEVEIIDYSFKEYKNILKNIDEKVETLKEKEKLEIKKYLDKINKILKKN